MGRSTMDKRIRAGRLPGPDIIDGAKYRRWSYEPMRAAIAAVEQLASEASAAK